MDQPAYYPLHMEQIERVTNDDGKVEVQVVAGELLGAKGSIPTLSPVNAAIINAKKDGKVFIPLPEHHNVMMYLLDGKLSIDGYGLTEKFNLLKFKNDGEGIGFVAMEDTRALLLSGDPLYEKVAKQGPFVMNDETQILEAMRDYQMGKMGILIEE
jgi:redox-sensitive bicupin YhaK (pirin superfamily)